MTERECSCGATFETLTRYRLHQRDECPDRDAELDIGDGDADGIAAKAVRELLVCDVCERPNEGAESINISIAKAKQEIGNLKMRGEVYEPSTGHLRTT